jgi:hypothetical protein
MVMIMRPRILSLHGAFTALVFAAALAFSPTDGGIDMGGGAMAGEPISHVGLPDAARPVVVELYTSQGCNTCPPADALAGELAELPGILPLSFHIDYWDYIGWQDRFALPGNTARQKAYSRALGSRFIYTPQMVVDGRLDVPGHRQRLVYSAIDKASRELPAVEVTFDAGNQVVRVGDGTPPPEGATVWLAVFDRKHTTKIERGENAGRELSYYNVVRDFRAIGAWEGRALEIPLELAQAGGNDACAVFLQTNENGPILGAATMALR